MEERQRISDSVLSFPWDGSRSHLFLFMSIIYLDSWVPLKFISRKEPDLVNQRQRTLAVFDMRNNLP